MGKKANAHLVRTAKKSNPDLLCIVYIGRILELDINDKHAETMAALLRD